MCAAPHLTTPPVIYRSENATEVFLEKLMEEEKCICTILSNSKPLEMTDEDDQKFRDATIYSICGEELCDRRVRDHDHVSGAFRGAAHNNCNLQYRLLRKKNKDDDDSYVISVVFHNLRGYDSHHIMEKLGIYKQKQVTVVLNTLEKYISFSLENLRFIDSLQFMGKSLEKLVHNIAQEEKQNIQEYEQVYPRCKTSKKRVYRYDYVDGLNKLQETSLPSKQDCYSLLSKLHILDDDYIHAHRVWEVFRCKILGDYHDIYLKSDVLQLADVFENFRSICHHNYGFDPAHYYTAPGLSWDAMLRYTKVKLEVITDIDMYLMIEKGIRGGVSNNYSTVGM